jgi:hypothetical protein
MKPRGTYPWPRPDEAPRLASLEEVLKQANVSGSTWQRLPDKPEPVLIGERGVKHWTNEIDAYLAKLPRASRVELPPAEPTPQEPKLLSHTGWPPLDDSAVAAKKSPLRRKRRKLLPPDRRRPRAGPDTVEQV